jgi:hypothetical protein
MVKMSARWDRSNLALIDVAMCDVIMAVDVDLPIAPSFSTRACAGQIPSPNVTWSAISHITNIKLLETLVSAKGTTNVLCSELGWFPASTSTEWHRVSVSVHQARMSMTNNTKEA